MADMGYSQCIFWLSSESSLYKLSVWLHLFCIIQAEYCLNQNDKKTYQVYLIPLTLKMPKKPASENVICLCRLLNILANFSNLSLHKSKQCGP